MRTRKRQENQKRTIASQEKRNRETIYQKKSNMKGVKDEEIKVARRARNCRRMCLEEPL